MSASADIDIRTATTADQAAVVQVLCEAFADDPVFSWIYPDRATRRRVLPGFFRLFAEASARLAGDLLADEGRGTAIWIPPGETMVPDDQLEAFGTALVELSPPDAARLSQSDEAFSAHHPSEPHWYLSLLGVGDAHQGMGVGSALLRHATARCDADGMPGYLEATSETNRRLYERHGFVVTADIVLPDGPTAFAMWREPNR